MTTVKKTTVKNIKWYFELGICAAGFVAGIVMFIVMCHRPDLWEKVSQEWALKKWDFIVWSFGTYFLGLMVSIISLPEHTPKKFDWVLEKIKDTAIVIFELLLRILICLYVLVTLIFVGNVFVAMVLDSPCTYDLIVGAVFYLIMTVIYLKMFQHSELIYLDDEPFLLSLGETFLEFWEF